MGGSAFKRRDEKGNYVPLTSKILIEEVDPTLEDFFFGVLSEIGISQMEKLGSTGKKAMSGDLDIAIGPTPDDIDTKIYKYNLLKSIESSLGSENVKVIGQNISVSYPIVTEDPNRAELRVQIDLMLSKNPAMTAWLMSGTGEGKVRGVYRNVLLSYLAKKQSDSDRKITIAFPGGIQVEEAGKVIVPRTEDPEKIMEILGIEGSPEVISDFSDLLDATKDKFDLSGFKSYMDPYVGRDPEGAQEALSVFDEKMGVEQAIRESIRLILEII